MKLLEREVQLGELLAALVRAGRGRGRGTTVLVAGEAGIGKTWLLQAFAERVADRARVLLGTCEDLLTPRTLGPFRDMAREEGVGGVRGEDREAVIDGLMREMRFARRPAVVIVEDAHWADDASLDIIRHLARRIERHPAMLVVSYRDEELTDDHPFRRIIGALSGPAVLHLVEGLSDATVARLAADAGLAPRPGGDGRGGQPVLPQRGPGRPLAGGAAVGAPRRLAGGVAAEPVPGRPSNGSPWSRPRPSCGWSRPCCPTWRCSSRPSGAGSWSPPSTGSGSDTSWPGGRSSSRSRPCGGSSTTGRCWGVGGRRRRAVAAGPPRRRRRPGGGPVRRRRGDRGG